MIRISEWLTQLEPNAIIVFGLLLLAGVIGGAAATRFKWIPTITALMIVGVIFGPHGAGIITKKMLYGSTILIDIALGLILYKLGSMINPKEILKTRHVLLTSLAESGLTFLAVSIVVLLFGYSGITAIIVGAIAVSSSPAVLVHVSEELRADGVVTEYAKSLVAMNNVLSFLIFTLALPFAMTGDDHSLLLAFGKSIYRFCIATILGLGVAWLAVSIAKLLKGDAKHYQFAVLIGAIMLTLGMSKMLGCSMLFSALVLGMTARWLEHDRPTISAIHLGEGGDLFLIMLFVMAGAKLDAPSLAAIGILPLVLVAVRSACKFAGVFIAHRTTPHTPVQNAATGLLLIPMAGMAIGLAATVNYMIPGKDLQITAIVFAMVAVFETIGPFAAVKAFRMSGEANQLLVMKNK